MVRSIDLPSPDTPDGKDLFVPDSRADWRKWLESRPDRTEGVWVAYPKKSSSVEGPAYAELVEEALCFGWIDSTNRRVDDDRLLQWFSPRRKGSVWSSSNKGRVERLVAEGRMTERGQAAIDTARGDGSWSQFDDAEAMVIHPDLQAAFDTAPVAVEAWQSTSPSQRKQDLWWVYSAKRSETRSNRIEKLIHRLSGME